MKRHRKSSCMEVTLQETTEKKKRFAQGIHFYKLFYVFLIGSIVGSYYEQILHTVTVYLQEGSLVWELRRGVIYGPFNVIYGIGAVLMVFFLCRKKRPWYETVLYGALIGGGFEYGVSLLQSVFLGSSSWDYSHMFLNIDGRTTIPIMLLWGLCCLALVHVIYPFISNMVERIPYQFGVFATNILVALMAINLFVSWTALIRQTLRRNNISPFTPIGRLYDVIYTDEYLSRYFPNMIPHQ